MTIIYLPCDVPRPLPKIVHRHHWVTPHHHHHAPAPVCDCGGGGALPGSGGSGEGFIEAPGGSSWLGYGPSFAGGGGMGAGGGGGRTDQLKTHPEMAGFSPSPGALVVWPHPGQPPGAPLPPYTVIGTPEVPIQPPLQNIPEPSTWLMLMLGAAAIAMAYRLKVRA